MGTKLERISELVAQNPKMVFTSLYHLIDDDLLKQCHREMNGRKATNVDKVTKDTMTEDRIITGVKVTHGGEPDGKQLPILLEKTKNNGVEVREIVGDMAYVSEDNLEICEENGVTLFAKTNSAVAAAVATPLDEGFCFNKDAGLLQSPAGELPMRMEKRAAKNGNTYQNSVIMNCHGQLFTFWTFMNFTV